MVSHRDRLRQDGDIHEDGGNRKSQPRLHLRSVEVYAAA